MSIFIYEAYDDKGISVHGEYEGANQDEIVDYLTKHNLTPVSVKENAKPKEGLLSKQVFEKLTHVDIMFLVRNLAATSKAGLSIVESLDIIIEDVDNKLMKKILEEARVAIKNGQPLSSAFENYSKLFPPIFVSMIKAGEISGQLDKSLNELASYLSKENNLRTKIKGALTYPIILLIATSGIVTLMLVFVLPRLTSAFASSGVKLPWFTQFFLTLSEILTYNLFLDAGVVIFLVWFFVYFGKTRSGKKFFFWIISHTPVAKDLVKKIALVRFSRTFGNLIGSGMSVIEALELSMGTMNNQGYVKIIKTCIAEIKDGITISAAFGKYPKLFPKLLISLIAVGERTGSLRDVFITFADFYDEEVDNKLKDLTTILEPILLLVMGLIVGSIAFAIIIPIYQLVGHFT